jgi:histidinol-phosphatase (PHP family)
MESKGRKIMNQQEKSYQITSNFHTHCYLCRHAEGTIEDYFEVAKQKHYQFFAMTDHGPLPDEISKNFFTRRMSEKEYHDIYLPQTALAIQKYSTDFKGYRALELEYFETMDKNHDYENFLKDMDFLVLGEHHLQRKTPTGYEYISIYSHMTKDEIILYKDLILEGMTKGYFKILAHPDIFLWGYPKFDEFAKGIAKELAEASIKYHVFIEMNANGIRNSKLKHKEMILNNGEIGYPYPNYDFWKEMKKYPVRILINDDAHHPEHIQDDATFEVCKMAEELKLNISHDLNW